MDIEEETLGILLCNPDYMKKTVIADYCFLDPSNKFIFNLIKKQYQEEKTINTVGIAENYKHLFNEKFTLNKIIEKMTLILTNTLNIKSSFDYYQQVLFSRYRENEIMKSIRQFEDSKISQEELFNMIHKYESMGISTEDNRLSSDDIFQLITSSENKISLRFKGISDVADIEEHALVIIAARPGTGKSAFLLNIMEDVSDNYKCLYFNMEMSTKQVYQRFIAINSDIPIKNHTALQTDYQENKLKESCDRVSSKNFKVYTGSQSISSIKRIIGYESKEEHVIAFIDYVGLIESYDKGTLYEKMTAIVKELRRISLDLNCTIFLAAQLNKESGKRKEKELPKLIDLKETGELEQSATHVFFLHDPNYGNNMAKSKINIEIVLAKNRGGKTGITTLTYDKSIQKFKEPENKIVDPNDWRNKNG